MALLILDIDNTLFDWVSYYTLSLDALYEKVEKITGIDTATLKLQSKDVFAKYGSIEYPFLVQELPAVLDYYKGDIDLMLDQCVNPARETFKQAALKHLTPYEGVKETLDWFQKTYPNFAIVALSDAPRYVAMWKMNKLGLLPYFAAIYGLGDPKLPVDSTLGRVKVEAEILLKHLERNNFGYQGDYRTLPDSYEKPGRKGLMTVLMDFDIDQDTSAKEKSLWVGDNLKKDVQLGKSVGVSTAWAKYGTHISVESRQKLDLISPIENIRKHANIDPVKEDAPQPDMVLEKFADLQNFF